MSDFSTSRGSLVKRTLFPVPASERNSIDESGAGNYGRLSIRGESVEDARTRAEDIILGGHGLGEDARLTELSLFSSGIVFCRGVWSDGSEFELEITEDLDQLESWAIDTLISAGQDDS